MENKMENQILKQKKEEEYFKLRNLDWLSSVWKITTVNPKFQKFELGESHSASFPEEVAYRLISLFSKEGDYILDPFCGSGTTNYVALALGRKTIGYDIEEKYIHLSKKRVFGKGLLFCKSSEQMNEVFDNSIQLCITSPPYLNIRKYSNNAKNIGNMNDPYPILKKVFEEVFRKLKKGGYFCLNVAGIAEEGYLNTFPFDLINLCKEIGFKLRSSIIWDKGITIKDWNIKNNEISENHEYIWIFKK